MLRAVRSLQTQKCGTFLPMVSVPLQKHRLSQSCPSRALLFVQKNRDDCSSWHMQKSTVKEVPTKPDGQPDGSRREHVCLSTNTHILDPDTALPNGQAVFPASDRTHYLVVGVAIQKCTKDCSPSCSRPVDMTWPWPYQVRQFTIPRGFCDVGKQPAGHEHALKTGALSFKKFWAKMVTDFIVVRPSCSQSCVTRITCCMLQVWWGDWLKNWLFAVWIGALPRPTFWQLKIWKNKCSLLLVVTELKCCMENKSKRK